MAKDKTDASVDSSATKGSKTDSPTVEDQKPLEDLSPEDQPGADEGAAEPEIRDDASLENQLGEAQRLLAKAQEREDKQYDDLIEITRTAQAQQSAPPQVNREDMLRRQEEEYEEAGISPEMAAIMDRRIAAEVTAGLAGVEARVGPGQRTTHDSLTKRAIADVVGEKENLKPFKEEIEKWAFENLTPETRLMYTPEAIADQAAASVAFAHGTEIEKAISVAATKEANLNRRVEGDVETSSSSQIITEGDAEGLHPMQVEFARKRGWSLDRMREANKRYGDNVKRKVDQSIRG